MTLVKMCGLTRPEDVEAVNRIRPDMIGFVFHGPCRRCVSGNAAEGLADSLVPSILKVGVFVDEDPRIVADLVGSGIVDAVQLHGVEDAAYIHGLRKLVEVPIIKSFIVRGGEDVVAAETCDADMVLLDSGRGSGRTFDWSLLNGIGRDYILSGGLDPWNVSDALGRLRPYGVDVSSGVETDGRKDPEKMRMFLEAVRSAPRD